MMSIETISPRPMPPATAGARTARRFPLIVASLFMRCVAIWERQRSRAALSDLTDAQLRDIGLTRREAIRESRRSIWDWNSRF